MNTPMRRNRSRCCARAAIGHAAAVPPRSVMNSRRFIPSASPMRISHFAVMRATGGLAQRSCRTPVTAKPMMMRAQTNMQAAVNRPLRETLGSLILGQSLAGAVRGRYCTPPLRQPTASATPENEKTPRIEKRDLDQPSRRGHAASSVLVMGVRSGPPEAHRCTAAT
jgi:hypothetical protein